MHTCPEGGGAIRAWARHHCLQLKLILISTLLNVLKASCYTLCLHKSQRSHPNTEKGAFLCVSRAWQAVS